MGDGALLWQVACEFVAASRKLAQFGFTQAEAWRELERLRLLWTMILPSEGVLTRAEQLTATHNLSFWDSMLVAACVEGGITRLYTEDFDAFDLKSNRGRNHQSVLIPVPLSRSTGAG
jgi:predicted nucleic acid-binding protein